MSYILEKIFSGFACLLAVYLIVENWIQPIIFELEAMSVIGAMIELLLPFLLVCLILFYFVFECLCCTLAEFMYYGNRQFYDDWWNRQK